MKAYLKGYYGYKNLGDELLFFGVVRYLVDKCGLIDLTVEVGDKKWFKRWIDLNAKFLPSNKDLLKIQLFEPWQGVISKVRNIWKYCKNLISHRFSCKVIGGWEVFTYQRGWFHGGWNMVLLYFWSILVGNFILLGWVGTPKTASFKFLYRFVLPRAKKVVVRDRISYDVVRKYTSCVELYQDFAQGVLAEFFSHHSGIKKESKIVINLHPSMIDRQTLTRIDTFVNNHPDAEAWYVPMADEDKPLVALLNKHNNIKIFDWTKHTLEETLRFMLSAKAGIGARLHFLFVLKVFQVPLEAVVYQEKVQKLILDS